MFKHLLAALLLATVLLTGLIACSKKPTDTPAAAPAATTIGINVGAMDPSVMPGDDFHDYANGAWLQATDIPADRSAASANLIAIEATEKHNVALIEELINTSQLPGSDAARIAKFYKAYMDVAAIDAAGMKPLQAELDRYAAIANLTELSAVLGSNLRADVDPLNATDYFTENLFGVFVTQGLSTPGEVLPYILQGGLGMPEREYYLSDDPAMIKIRTAYRDYVEEMLNVAGIDDAAARADRIVALENKIAAAHVIREDSTDFSKSTAIWSRDDFDIKAPGIEWQTFLDAARLGNQQKFAAYHASAISGLSALVAAEPLDAWKDWLTFHHISTYAAVLPTAIDQTRFAFNGTVLFGIPQQRPRNERALRLLDRYLRDAVGRAYVEKYFPASTKAEVETMVGHIVDAFAERVQAIDWMALSTKTEALAKVSSIVVGVGYPDAWRDYRAFPVSADDAYGNVVNGKKVEYAYQLAKIGKPLDRHEWWMPAQLVNAVNLPVQNALNFPAAILQAPFFVADADPAFNYGAIGAVIGHEISHSFDDNGAAFDANGTMRNWWTEEDFVEFERQGTRLAEQYDQYAPFPDLHVNGQLTLGENIADLAGLTASYDAYRTSLNGEEAPIIGGFTGDQRFFIGYAQTWATKMRDAALRQRIATDGHAPGNYRALTVRNIDAWYDAFDVQPGDDLYLAPDMRVRIW